LTATFAACSTARWRRRNRTDAGAAEAADPVAGAVALPWEFLYNPDRAEHLCLLRTTPLVRYIEIGNPIKPLVVEPPLRILGVAANSSSHAPLDVEREKQRMDNALRKLRCQDRVELRWLPTGTWRELQAVLRRETWHVLHFVGHGGFDEQNEEGLLILADDEGSQDYYPLAASKLADLLRPHPTLRFVLLNSCEGARAAAATSSPARPPRSCARSAGRAGDAVRDQRQGGHRVFAVLLRVAGRRHSGRCGDCRRPRGHQLCPAKLRRVGHPGPVHALG
jgi:hypothetical protein